MKKAHVTHPELKCTFCLGILGVKKNPNGTSYTQLGVITKGTVIEVSPSALSPERSQPPCHVIFTTHVTCALFLIFKSRLLLENVSLCEKAPC